MQETWVWSLGQEHLLAEEMATHSSILAWRIKWTEESGRLQFMGLQRVRHDWETNTHTHTLVGKNVLIVMVPILINKDMFESIYSDLKFMVWNHNCVCTNLLTCIKNNHKLDAPKYFRHLKNMTSS